ncbi:MAG TPA: response regulator [Polyangiaceae bacterium]|jgi:CheY-like chemotaxis protein
MNSDQPGDKASSKNAQESNPPARFGGARADFVASLGRKVNDARSLLTTLEAELGTPSERGPRDELRRRLYALSATARMLHFDAMVQALAEADAALERIAQGTRASDDDLSLVAGVLDDLPALAWGEGPRGEAKKPSDPPPAEEMPLGKTALLVGSEMLAEALTDDEIVPGAPPYECERTEDAQAAIGLARKVAPEVVVIDADVPDAAELVEALLDDPFTEPVPIVVVGAFRDQGSAARFVALGVARTLTKPITAELLRRACDEAVDQRHEVTMRVTLGEPTLEQLGERLADEVRRALVEGVDGAGRGVRVPLGEGTEVMSALWGAIARVREVVVARTGGAVRFGTTGPEGAVALAPWLHPDVPGTDRTGSGLGSRGRGPAADIRLHGRRVIVADDDPGVTWFIADLLRTAGCNVHEALDGTTALDLAYRVSPELVISDILMPGLDGFALARALKRDVALRDVPVILLSWKEDLLQRVRELGASAAAYLRKESDSRSIVARVRECLRPRARIEARLRSEGEVRGRLDGLTVRSLLELACSIRPDSRVSVRDASFLYEVEIRDGAPRRITRTSSEGTFDRGERALAALIGVGAGRFTVASSAMAISAEDRDLSGSLTAQLARPIAIARAARNVTTGARTLGLEKVRIEPETLTALLVSTPEPARRIVKALADGASPRGLLLAGEVDPSLLEEVLGDLAARGAIRGVWTQGGDEVLAKAVDALLATPEPALRSASPPRSRAPSSRPPPVDREPPPPGPSSGPRDVDLTPSSLADAVMRELSERAPELRTRSSNPPPIVEPSELKPRSSTPPGQTAPRAPSIPPDAIVPALEEADDRTEIDAPVGPSKHLMLGLEEEIAASIPIDFSPLLPSVLAPPVAPAPEPMVPASQDEISVAIEPPGRTPLAASVAAGEPGPSDLPVSRARWPWVMALGFVGLAVVLGVQATQTALPSAASAGALVESPATTGVPVATAPGAAKYEELPEGLAVPPGQGVLELTAAMPTSVFIDGVARGSGANVRVPLTAGPHQVLAAGIDRAVEVRAGRMARVDLSVGP